MATLNVKAVPETLHRKLRKQAKLHHRSVAQEVIHILSKVLERPATHSILELKGLGKELWAGVDPAKYVADERDAWD
jgi:plasmid stability protein